MADIRMRSQTICRHPPFFLSPSGWNLKMVAQAEFIIFLRQDLLEAIVEALRKETHHSEYHYYYSEHFSSQAGDVLASFKL
jgi:hypothetical protein